MMATATYATYLVVSIAVTAWVARTLHRSGRVFLIDAFAGNAAIADSVNQLLVVGFYLINLGYVLLMLRMREKPATLETAIEFLSVKQGFVLLVLGAMHFGNLALFSAIRRSRVLHERNAVHGEHSSLREPQSNEAAPIAGAAS